MRGRWRFGACAGGLCYYFSTRARGAVLGLAWNVAAALVGGTAPAFAVLLIEVTGSDVAPGFYISVLAMLAVGGIRALPRAPRRQGARAARDWAAGSFQYDLREGGKVLVLVSGGFGAKSARDV